MRPERLQVGLRIMLVLGILLSFPARPVLAQYGAELEVERNARATTTRLEVLEGRFYALRAERVRNLSTTMGHSTGLIKEQFPVWRGVWWED